MATPVVSGAAALLLQQHPSLTPDQIKARLMKTAYKTFPSSSTATDTTTGTVYTSYYDIFTVGAGYLDVGAALKDTTIWQGQAASPVAVFSNGTPQLSFSSLTTCSDPQYWAMSAIWGTTEISGTTIWTYNAALGKQAVSATQAIWGTVSRGTAGDLGEPGRFGEPKQFREPKRYGAVRGFGARSNRLRIRTGGRKLGPGRHRSDAEAMTKRR